MLLLLLTPGPQLPALQFLQSDKFDRSGFTLDAKTGYILHAR